MQIVFTSAANHAVLIHLLGLLDPGEKANITFNAGGDGDAGMYEIEFDPPQNKVAIEECLLTADDHLEVLEKN